MTSTTRKPRTTKRTVKKSPAKKGARKSAVFDVVSKIEAIRDRAARMYVGRDEVAEAIALGIVSERNLLLIGVPGTAKTAIVKEMVSSFCPDDGDIFSVLLTKFTTPKEVFGPIDILKLKEGKNIVLTDGYLPSAKVAVLDEVFKGSSAILNSLLTIVNEGIFKANGTTWEKCPLRMTVGISNEYPEDPTLLAAFYDRFPIKLKVDSLDGSSFRNMLDSVCDKRIENAKPVQSLTDADFDEINALRNAVTVSSKMLDTISEIREQARVKGVEISDRRWVQVINILKAHAVMNRTTEVTVSDLKCLSYVVWNTDDDRSIINQILPQFAEPIERELMMIFDEINHARHRVLSAAIGANGEFDGSAASTEAVQARQAIQGQRNCLEELSDYTDDSDIESVEAIEEMRVYVETVLSVVTRVGTGSASVEELKKTIQS